jgi:hypothetical protein
MVIGAKMSDTVSALSNDQVLAMSTDAQQFGMSPENVAEILNKYGPDMLSVVVSGLKNGFSVSFCMELLKLFGPVVLDALTAIYNKTKTLVGAQSLSATAATETAVADILAKGKVESIPPAILNILMEKLLPWALEKYGQQIISAIIETVLTSIKSEETQANVK